MAYRLRADEPVVHGLVRIALEQIDRSLGEIADSELARPEVVHQVRKRCKKIRGLLRLSRSALADVYQLENDWFRDAAAQLADVRAVDAMSLALESLRSEKGPPVADAVWDLMRDVLAGCNPVASQSQTDVDARLADFAQAMQVARQRMQHWSDDRTAPAEISTAVMDSFRKTYRRGRRALRTALQVQADEYLHEFRTWAKYHWYHVKLLQPLAPRQLRRRARRLAELSDLLGDDRDLGALRRVLLEQLKGADRSAAGHPLAGHPFAGHTDEVEQVVAAIDRRRGRLRREAFRLCKQLYQLRPKAYVRQLGKRWQFPEAPGESG